MKVTSPRVIVIQEDGAKPERYTDPSKAAERWARVKADEWVAKNCNNPKYINTILYRTTINNLLYDDGRIRYRKLKRRALVIFRRIMEVNG